jgi:predicted ATPase
VQDLIERALPLGVATWQGGADAIEADTPYYPWRRVFVEMLGLAASGDLSVRRGALLRALGPALAERAALLEPLLALGLSDTPTTAELSGQPRATAARELMIELLTRQIETRPSSVVLEDAHWFDQASWALALEVGRRLPGLLLVLTLRPLAEPRPAEWVALAESALCRVLTLHPFSADEVTGLVCQRLAVAAIPPEVDALIASLAAGLPLFAEELASALLDAGAIQIVAGECRLTPGFDLQELVLPATVQGVVGVRLDRLLPHEALLIKVCSVIGMAFSAQLLRDVYPVRDDAAVLEQVMQRLHDVGLMVLDTPESVPVYAFKHVITQEVAYNLMLFSQRRQLHQAVAEWYETQYTEDRPDLLALLAHHWACAGVVPKAVVYLERSAMRMFSMGLGRAAVDQGLVAARLLAVNLPTDPSAIAPLLGAELARIQDLLDGRQAAALLAHRALDDAPAGSVIALLLRIMPFAHQSAQGELFALMALRCMSLTLLHGHGPGAPVVYAMHSIVYRALTGDSVSANRFAELALALDLQQGRQLLGPVSFIHTWFNQHWVQPVSRALPLSREAADVAFAVDDVLYGCFNLSAHVVHLAVSGQALAVVIDVAASHLRRNGRRVLNAAFHCVQELQLAKALAGLTRSLTSLSDDEFDEQRDIRSICETDHYNQIGYYHICRLRLLLLYRQPSQALEAADRAQALLGAIAGQVGEFELVFLHALALLARARELSRSEASLLLLRADALHAQLRAWAELCDANFGHKALLVQAERSRTTGALDVVLYLQAALSAADAGFVQYEALAHELHAEALQAAGRPGMADAVADAVAQAKNAYGRWGAAAKLADLTERFG